jgi:hypothetical protein
MTCREEHERWKTKVGISEVTPQVLWPIVNSLMKMVGPKALTALHGPLGTTYHPNVIANMTADCLENQFTSHTLYEESMIEGWRVESKLCSHL